MPTVVFAKAFRRHVDCPDAEVAGSTVGDTLDAYFGGHPKVKSYVLDEAGAVRRHVTLFVGERQVNHKEALAVTVGADDTVYVFQALSGG